MRGMIQKGPFEKGSEVSVVSLAARGRPQGWIHRTWTIDDLGCFVAPRVRGGVMIEGVGRAWDELTGELSEGTLRLRAVHEVEERDQEVNVNVFTHVTSRRIVERMRSGESIRRAIRKAEEELVRVLPLPAESLAVGEIGAGMTLVAGRYRGFLLSLGAAAIMACRLMGGRSARPGETERLQAFLDGLAASFGSSGTLDPSQRSWLESGFALIDATAVAARFEGFLARAADKSSGPRFADSASILTAA